MQYLKQKEGNFLERETLSSSVEDSLIAKMASRSARSLSVVGSDPGSIHRAMAPAGGGGRVVKQTEEGSPRCYYSFLKYYLSIFYTTAGCWLLAAGCWRGALTLTLPSLNEDFLPI